MRRIIAALTLAAVMLVPDGCRRWNHPPNTPSEPNPADSSTGVDTAAVLSWLGGDQDRNDVVTYFVFLGRGTPVYVDSFTDTTRADTVAYRPAGLQRLATYNWRIIARDMYSESAVGDTWSFTTQIPGRAPNKPSDPQPDSGARDIDPYRTVLKWQSGDPDGDPVLYRVFLDTLSQLSSPIDSVGDSTSFRPDSLRLAKKYYWKIEAVDSGGLRTMGPVWAFTTMTTANNPPTKPRNPQPDSGAVDVDTAPSLSWVSSDPDAGDTVSFDLYLGTSPSPPLVRTGLDSARFDTSGLRFGTVYYWKVDAYDNHQATSTGSVWRFRTMGTNQPPYVPSSPTPDSGATGVTRRPVLAWSGGDPDSGDTVVYDVYFGDTLAPPLLEQGHPDTTFALGSLLGNRLYYWKIVARDSRGDTAVSPVWCFTTEAGVLLTEPNDSTRWRMGSDTAVRWTSGWSGPDVRVRAGARLRGAEQDFGGKGIRLARRLWDLQEDSAHVYISRDDGGTWTLLGRSTQSGVFRFRVRGPRTDSARVYVNVFDNGAIETDTSPRFAIYDTLRPGAITVTSPAGGEEWTVGDTHLITWNGGTDGVDSTVIFYSTDNGANWLRQGKTILPGSYPWVVPGPPTDRARIQVKAHCVLYTALGTSEQFEVRVSLPDSIHATVAVGGNPRAMVWNATDDMVYVANRGGNSVTVISGDSTNEVVTTIPVGSAPSSMVWHPVRNQVFVANEAGSSVFVISCATNAVVDSFRVRAIPKSLCWDRTDDKLYVANYNDNSVTVIDLEADSVLRHLPVGQRPQGLCWNPAANKVYAACFQSNEVAIINCSLDSVIARLAVGFGPTECVADSAGNEVYVSIQNNTPTGRVTAIDGVTNTTLANINVGQGPIGLCWNPQAAKAYSANSRANTVSVIDNHVNVADLAVGTDPRTLVWASLVNVVYAASAGSDQVHIIDGTSNQVLGQLTVGDSPVALCWNPTDRKVYVANDGADTVTIIGTRR